VEEEEAVARSLEEELLYTKMKGGKTTKTTTTTLYIFFCEFDGGGSSAPGCGCEEHMFSFATSAEEKIHFRALRKRRKKGTINCNSLCTVDVILDY
jgi:hypothetical protein